LTFVSFVAGFTVDEVELSPEIEVLDADASFDFGVILVVLPKEDVGPSVFFEESEFEAMTAVTADLRGLLKRLFFTALAGSGSISGTYRFGDNVFVDPLTSSEDLPNRESIDVDDSFLPSGLFNALELPIEVDLFTGDFNARSMASAADFTAAEFFSIVLSSLCLYISFVLLLGILSIVSNGADFCLVRISFVELEVRMSCRRELRMSFFRVFRSSELVVDIEPVEEVEGLPSSRYRSL
jgi:hypothetical protein